MTCPKCKSNSISYQREQAGTMGTSTNTVVIQKVKSHSCLWWLMIGWWWKLIYWICIGWWWKPLFGKKKSGLNIHANKSINRTMAVCQNCGHSWKA